MTEQAKITAENQSWDEQPYQDLAGDAKLARASVKQKLHGDLDGEAGTEFLMCYLPDGTATFIGQTLITGTLGGRTGSFVVQANGGYSGSEASWSMSVVPGSGTDELRGLRGEGSASAPHGSQATLTLEYDFDGAAE